MAAISQNHTEFAARLARIEKGVASAQQLLFVGTDEVYSVRRRERKPKASPLRRLVGWLLFPMALVIALTIGAASYSAAEVAMFHLQDQIKGGDGLSVRWGLGLAMALATGFFLQKTTTARVATQVIGVVIGFLVFPSAVHKFPTQFTNLTSATFVQEVVASSTPIPLAAVAPASNS